MYANQSIGGSIYNAEEKKVMKERISNYSKYVKEMYQPKVSEKKQLELKEIKEHIGMTRVRKSVESGKLCLRKTRPFETVTTTAKSREKLTSPGGLTEQDGELQPLTEENSLIIKK